MPEEYLREIKDLRVEIGKIKANYDEKEKIHDSLTLQEKLTLESLDSIDQRIVVIKKIISQKKMRLVFIGQVGTGKTTAICHMFNLITTENSTFKLPNGKQSTFIKHREILTTGSGRTTLCEVVVRPDSKTFITIDPYSIEEVSNIIHDYCRWIWSQVHGENISPDNKPITEEMSRVIRNIINSTKNPNATDLKNINIDPSKEKAMSYKNDEFKDFYQFILLSAHLEMRTRTEWIPESDCKDEKMWIKDIFDKINRGTLPQSSIPKSIFIHIRKDLISLPDSIEIVEIIDTKGLEQDRRREDLDSYMKANDTICLFVDRFNSAPDNVSKLLKLYCGDKSNKDNLFKSFLLIAPQNGEPQDLQTDAGPAEDWDVGIATKKNQVQNVLSIEKIFMSSNQVIFYNAKRFFDDKGEIEHLCDYTDIENERKKITEIIRVALENRNQKLFEEFSNLKKRSQQIIQGKPLSPQNIKAIQKAREKIGTIDKESKIDLVSYYISYLKEYHVSTFRAINNRYGKYDANSIYYDMKVCTEELLENYFEEKIENIIECMREISYENFGDPFLNDIVKQIIVQIRLDFEKYKNKLGDDMSINIETIRVPLANLDNPHKIFWQTIIERWGQGIGYRKDVLQAYEYHIDFVAIKFNGIWLDRWSNEFMKPLLKVIK